MPKTRPSISNSRSHRRSDGHTTGGEAQVEAFRDKHLLGTRPRLALELSLNTAQRRGDVVRMGRQHIRNGGIYVKQRKTGVELTLPVLPELAAAIAAMPNEHLTFLVTISGKPFSDAGFGNWFRECRDEAGLKGYSAHGLRNAGYVRLAEAGCTEKEIAVWRGHLALSEVARYTRAADQKRLAWVGVRREPRSVTIHELQTGDRSRANYTARMRGRSGARFDGGEGQS